MLIQLQIHITRFTELNAFHYDYHMNIIMQVEFSTGVSLFNPIQPGRAGWCVPYNSLHMYLLMTHERCDYIFIDIYVFRWSYANLRDRVL